MGRDKGVREVRLVAAGLTGARDVHDHLARELGFPSYYGHNLAALADCLGDVCVPTCLVVDLTGPTAGAAAEALERMVPVMRRAARENPFLSVRVVRSPGRRGGSSL
ncbi:MAG: barstar family protein [Atopobiaceae bacterium]|jgi:RNAse (barnase) inhibitor barstar|nr:barstar family protein [Atopobiaceae bacterium]